MAALFIFVLAFWIRFHNLWLLPINHDEARWAYLLLRYPEQVKESASGLINFLPSFLRVLLFGCVSEIKTFNLNDFALHLRLPSVVAGTATVILIYLLAKQMYGNRAALISSLLLCVLPWHIIHSRIMERVIWVPLFGCLIFLCLLRAQAATSRIAGLIWFMLSCLFLDLSLRKYESAVLFIPIFIISLLFLRKKTRVQFNFKKFLIIIFIAGIFVIPFFCEIQKSGGGFCKYFFRHYHKNIFEGSLMSNIILNLKNNMGLSIQQLFFASRANSFLYGQALKAPLLVHPAVFILMLGALVSAVLRRNSVDFVMLVWLLGGFLGAIGGISLFQERYVLIILPPALIMLGKFLSDILNYAKNSNSSKRLILTFSGTLFICGILSMEIYQWRDYYLFAPFDLNECRNNSYGSQEAAEYLSKQSDIFDYEVIYGERMTVYVYLNYYLLNEGVINKCHYFEPGETNEMKRKGRIYLAWASESHPHNYMNSKGLFEFPYYYLKQKHPDLLPIRKINYPNGIPAMYIFKTTAEDENG